MKAILIVCVLFFSLIGCGKDADPVTGNVDTVYSVTRDTMYEADSDSILVYEKYGVIGKDTIAIPDDFAWCGYFLVGAGFDPSPNMDSWIQCEDNEMLIYVRNDSMFIEFNPMVEDLKTFFIK